MKQAGEAKERISLQRELQGSFCYFVGQTIVAPVKKANVEGIVLDIPEIGSAVVSTKRLGSVAARAAVIKRIQVGSSFEAVVRAYYPRTKQLVLEPTEASIRSVVAVARKPSYAPLAKGSVLIVDLANLIGALGPEDAARKLNAIRNELIARGYKLVCFLEHRTRDWMLYSQATEAEREALRAFMEDAEVALVNGEADLPILQCARALPGSACLTRDRFLDYKVAFCDIVGTSRVRSFSVVRFDGRVLFSINGMTDAIVITEQKNKHVEPVAQRACTRMHTAAVVGNELLIQTGNMLLDKGKVKSAVDMFDRAVRKNDPEGYRALANVYGRHGAGKRADVLSKKYNKLACRLEARNRDLKIRYSRMVKRYREGWIPHPHYSSRRLSDFSLVRFGIGHEEIAEYLRHNRRSAGYVHAA